MRLCPTCQRRIKDQMRFCPACGSHVAELVGTLLDGEYRVERKIGETGLGTLYDSLQVSTNSRILVYVLDSHLFGSRTLLTHIDDVVRAMASIDDPSIAKVWGAVHGLQAKDPPPACVVDSTSIRTSS